MRRSLHPWLVVALLWVVIVVNYIDRQLIYSVFPLIKTDMKLSDVELGLIFFCLRLGIRMCESDRRLHGRSLGARQGDRCEPCRLVRRYMDDRTYAYVQIA